jgi:hypothetical protein
MHENYSRDDQRCGNDSFRAEGLPEYQSADQRREENTGFTQSCDLRNRAQAQCE